MKIQKNIWNEDDLNNKYKFNKILNSYCKVSNHKLT